MRERERKYIAENPKGKRRTQHKKEENRTEKRDRDRAKNGAEKQREGKT